MPSLAWPGVGWLVGATGLLVVMTLVVSHRQRSLRRPAEDASCMPILVERARQLGQAFRDLDEQAREISRRLPPPERSRGSGPGRDRPDPAVG